MTAHPFRPRAGEPGLHPAAFAALTAACLSAGFSAGCASHAPGDEQAYLTRKPWFAFARDVSEEEQAAAAIAAVQPAPEKKKKKSMLSLFGWDKGRKADESPAPDGPLVPPAAALGPPQTSLGQSLPSNPYAGQPAANLPNGQPAAGLPNGQPAAGGATTPPAMAALPPAFPRSPAQEAAANANRPWNPPPLTSPPPAYVPPPASRVPSYGAGAQATPADSAASPAPTAQAVATNPSAPATPAASAGTSVPQAPASQAVATNPPAVAAPAATGGTSVPQAPVAQAVAAAAAAVEPTTVPQPAAPEVPPAPIAVAEAKSLPPQPIAGQVPPEETSVAAAEPVSAAKDTTASKRSAPVSSAAFRIERLPAPTTAADTEPGGEPGVAPTAVPEIARLPPPAWSDRKVVPSTAAASPETIDEVEPPPAKATVAQVERMPQPPAAAMVAVEVAPADVAPAEETVREDTVAPESAEQRIARSVARWGEVRHYRAVSSWQVAAAESDRRVTGDFSYRKEPQAARLKLETPRACELLYAADENGDKVLVCETHPFGRLIESKTTTDEGLAEMCGKPLHERGIGRMVEELEAAAALAREGEVTLQAGGFERGSEVGKITVRSKGGDETLEYHIDLKSHLPVAAIVRGADGKVLDFESYTELTVNSAELAAPLAFDADSLRRR